MKTVLLLALLGTVGAAQAGVMAFLTHQEVSGLNKICFYQGPKGESAITIANYQLCPQTVQQ